METTKEYNLDNLWRVTFTPENINEDGEPFNVRISVEHKNGNKFEHEFDGQVKRDGCCDLGFNQPVMLHFCGANDTKLFAHIFVDAMEILNPREPATFILNVLGIEQGI